MNEIHTKNEAAVKTDRGFTLIEFLVGSVVMLVVVLGALAIYSKSNKTSVAQQLIADIQNNVRSSMFLISRDVRMAGAGLPAVFGAYALEGTDNEDQGVEVAPDRLKIMGNIDEPLNLPISNYQGSSVTVSVEDYSFEQYPYPDEFYTDKYVLILPNPDSSCRAGEIRIVTHLTHSDGGANEKMNFSPGLAPDVDPPGGLSGTCPSSNDYDGGLITFVNVKEFWLDVTGNYPGLTAGERGYIGGGQGGILYLTLNSYHTPLADNVENLQFEYNGDFNDDGNLDGWSPWQTTWTLDQVSRLSQVRIWILGRTSQPIQSAAKQAPGGLHLYRRPAVSNSPAATANDGRKRFLLDSTSSVRNTTLNIYNTGTR